jgi:hypothetical protein
MTLRPMRNQVGDFIGVRARKEVFLTRIPGHGPPSGRNIIAVRCFDLQFPVLS